MTPEDLTIQKLRQKIAGLQEEIEAYKRQHEYDREKLAELRRKIKELEGN